MKNLSGRHIVLVLAALIVVLAAVHVTGVVPKEAFESFLDGSVRGGAAWRKTLREMTPLLVAGLAVFIALRAGLFNIGADGQLVMGALAATAVALVVHGPAGIVLGCLAAMIAGALWAWPAGWIKAYRGGHEVISTIMLNNVALFLSAWLAAGPLRDPAQQSPTTRLLKPDSFFPNLIADKPFQLNAALMLGVLGVLLVAVWLKRTVSGYEFRAVGANPIGAETAGVSVKKVIVRAMVVSGAVAGLAGALLVLAFEHRFYANFSPGYGFDAVGVALLSGGSPMALLPSALLFAVLGAGSTAVQLTGVPKGISGILLGLLIIVFASVRYRRLKVGDS